MPPGHVTEGTKISDLYNDSAVGMQSKGHAKFKKNIRACLRRRLLLILVLSTRPKVRMQERHIVGRQKTDHCSDIFESRFQGLTDVGWCRFRFSNEFSPFEGVEIEWTKEIEHGRSKLIVAPINYKNISFVHRVWFLLFFTPLLGWIQPRTCDFPMKIPAAISV